MKESAYKKVSLTLKSGNPPKNFMLDGAQQMEISATGASFIFKGDVNYLLQEIAKHPLANIDIAEPTLEEIFMHYYAG